MSTDVRGKAREAGKSVKQLLVEVKNAANARLSKETPKVVNALDGSFDRASKGLTDALKTVEKRTGKEQAELLKAYRSFLQKQTEIIDKRMASISGKKSED